jgi:hypothetical protein
MECELVYEDIRVEDFYFRDHIRSQYINHGNKIISKTSHLKSTV